MSAVTPSGAEASRPAPGTGPPAHEVGDGRVLVVDDEEPNRVLLRDWLEAQGHAVTEAADGEQALEAVGSTAPDVILLDVMLPRMDGFEVCRRLKADARTAPIPILLITALTDRQDRLAGIQAGANDFLTKPIDAPKLRRTLARHVRRSPGTQTVDSA